jgi:hypothetical protein
VEISSHWEDSLATRIDETTTLSTVIVRIVFSDLSLATLPEALPLHLSPQSNLQLHLKYHSQSSTMMPVHAIVSCSICAQSICL